MIINNSKQFAIYKEKSEFLLKQICQYEDESKIPSEIISEYTQISDAIIEYEAIHHPFPWKVSTLTINGSAKQLEKKHQSQRQKVREMLVC